MKQATTGNDYYAACPVQKYLPSLFIIKSDVDEACASADKLQAHARRCSQARGGRGEGGEVTPWEWEMWGSISATQVWVPNTAGFTAARHTTATICGHDDASLQRKLMCASLLHA